MRKFLILPAAVLLLGFSSSVLAQDAAAGKASCCATSKLTDASCCGSNYIDGVAIKSDKLYKALSGRKINDAAAIHCDGCKAALKSDGTCKQCNVSFAGGFAYKSKVAYLLAKGTAADTSKLKCEGCQAAARKDHGWCDSCNVGVVGNRVFKNKKDYQAAAKARVILAKAIKASETCEDCAVAMVTDGTCQSCKVSFKNGKTSKNSG